VSACSDEHGRCLVVVLLGVIAALVIGYVAVEYYLGAPEVVIDAAVLKNSLTELSYEDLAERAAEHRGKAVSYRGRVTSTRGNAGLTVQITPENIGFWNEVVHLDLMGETRGIKLMICTQNVRQ
jgi:hypothetical protein